MYNHTTWKHYGALMSQNFWAGKPTYNVYNEFAVLLSTMSVINWNATHWILISIIRTVNYELVYFHVFSAVWLGWIHFALKLTVASKMYPFVILVSSPVVFKRILQIWDIIFNNRKEFKTKYKWKICIPYCTHYLVWVVRMRKKVLLAEIHFNQSTYFMDLF